MVRRHPGTKAILVLIATGLAAACSDQATQAAPGRGVVARNTEEGELADPMAEGETAEDDRESDDEDDESEPVPVEEPAAQEPQAATPRVRDLSHELRTAYGDPTRCLGALPPNVSRVTVTVSGTVFVDGVVSGAHVSSSYSDGAVLQCLRAMAGSLRIEGDVPGAPRTVTATLEVQR